jgi:acyl carrier protein
MMLDTVRSCMQSALKLNDDETRAVSLESTPLNVRGWTSLSHVELVLALERTFNVEFEATEIMDLASVAAIVSALERRQPE